MMTFHEYNESGYLHDAGLFHEPMPLLLYLLFKLFVYSLKISYLPK